MSKEVNLLIRKHLAKQVLEDFVKWVKANTIIICQPSIREIVDDYLERIYQK